MNPLSPTRTAPASRPPPTEINSITNNRWGGVVGVGAEWAVGGGWTLKSEALYMESMTFCGVPRTSGTAGANLVG